MMSYNSPSSCIGRSHIWDIHIFGISTYSLLVSLRFLKYCALQLGVLVTEHVEMSRTFEGRLPVFDISGACLAPSICMPSDVRSGDPVDYHNVHNSQSQEPGQQIFSSSHYPFYSSF